MIVQIDYRIEKPYHERLDIMQQIIKEEIQRRKKVVDLNIFAYERAHAVVFTNELFSNICYSCIKPIWFSDDEIMFVEKTPDGIKKSYLHFDCLKQKV